MEGTAPEKGSKFRRLKAALSKGAGIAFDKLEQGVLRLGGLLGGLIWGIVASLTVLHFCFRFGWSLLWFVFFAALLVPSFCILGVCVYRYFALFLIPIFEAFFCEGGSEGGDAGSDSDPRSIGETMKEGLPCLGLLIALVAIPVGALFQWHAVFALGFGLFVTFAILAPGIFVEKGKAK